MLLLGHRGASHDAPENTLEAFAEAVRQGADGVELDAMVCGSGEVVVCHDEFLHRLAGLPWEVRRTPWWKLQRADVGSTLGFAPTRIPLLEEVLEALPRSLLVNIELKCDVFDDAGLSNKVCALVARMGAEGRVLLSSFNPWSLFRAAEAGPALRRGFLIDPDKPFLPQRAVLAPLTGRDSIHPHWSQLTAERAADWQAQGLKIVTWTVDSAEEAQRQRALGVYACISNRPGALRRELDGL